MASHCSGVRPWAWSRMARSCARWFISWATSGSGTSSSTSSARASPVASRSAPWAWALRTTVPRSRIDPQLVDGVELGDLGRPLVVDLGQHALLHLLDQHPELELALLVGVGVGGVELEDVADLGAA